LIIFQDVHANFAAKFRFFCYSPTIKTPQQMRGKQFEAVVSVPFNVSPGSIATTPARQIAALCWRLRKGVMQVLLISSRDTGRWVIPKGWPIDGMNPAAAAAREAWEEAGAEGRVAEVELGAFGYDKQLKTASIPCSVSVFALQVRRLAHRFPEHKQRLRRWVAPEEAAKLVQEPGLQALLGQIARNPALIGAEGPALP
jgi:8-oxo-dGTP pyrophosphatase MutT (NUDIX family)